MKVSEDLDIKGRLTLQKRNADDEILAEIAVNNTIVLTGRDLVARLFINQPGIRTISHVAVGTDNAVTTGDDKQLKAECFRKEIGIIKPDEVVTTNQGRRKVTISVDLELGEANSTKPLTEAGLFNAQQGGVMYNRVIFSPISKTNQFKLTLIWEIIF